MMRETGRLGRRRWLAAARAAALAACAVAAFAAASARQDAPPVAAQAATPSVPALAPAPAIALHDIYFDPAALAIPAYVPVRIALANLGAARHSFVIASHNNPGLPDLGVLVDLGPGETGEAVVSAPPGTWYFYCDEPGHEAAGMHGLLTVR